MNLRGAPLIVSLAALDSHSQVTFDWPQTLDFSQLKLPKEDQSSISGKLSWIKRQYDVLASNPKTRAFAPHVVPYLARTDLNIRADGAMFANASQNLRRYPLVYTENLAAGLRRAYPQTGRYSDENTEVSNKTKGQLIQDRVRFRVVKAQPLNELEIGINLLYTNTGLSWADTFANWLELSYGDKADLLQEAIGAGQIAVNYQLEVVLEPQLLLDGAMAGLFTVVAWQKPTPSYGYALPKKLNDGGMLERCFDISYKLYAQLQTINPLAAPLVCLWGHRQRALVNIDQSHLERYANKLPKRLGKLATVLKTKLREKHPLIWESF